MSKKPVYILTGLSGSGKSTAARVLEDRGFFVIDNLPLTLLPQCLELTGGGLKGGPDLAVVVDVRNRDFLAQYESIIRQVAELGYPLEILKHEGKWAQCQDFEGDRGWIHTDLLNSGKTVIVRKKMVNMRGGAGKSYETVATVKYGVIFTPLEKDGDWLKIKHEDGTEGWIFNSLVWPADPL